MSIMDWLKTDVAQRSPLGAVDPVVASKPPLETLYAFYLTAFAPLRGTATHPLADFVEVLRQYDKTKIYSDEEWIAFFFPFTGDQDVARDLWDGYVCQ